MIKIIMNFLRSLFGSKSDRDIKSMNPIVEEINQHFEEYKSISNDELRGKTIEFRKIITNDLKNIDDKIVEINDKINTDESLDAEAKEDLFRKIDKLDEQRNEELEIVLDKILPEAFAVVKETARRFTENETIEVTTTERDKDLSVSKDYVSIKGNKTIYKNSWDAAGIPIVWNMVHYDVQLAGGIVLHRGKIAEMATGEGKTLVSTLPSYLNALASRGVHLITVNDYLARRDCEWNGPLLEFLGISVDCIEYYKANSKERRGAYLADVTYGTNNEFGFDYLRDNMARNPEDLVQRKHHFTMVDEVDSVLIDDARTPLIISGPTETSDKDQDRFYELKPRVEKLMQAQKQFVNKALNIAKKELGTSPTAKTNSEAAMMLLRAFRGLPKSKALIKYLSKEGVKSFLLKTENFFLQEQSKHMPEIDQELFFVIDEKNNSIEISDKGVDLITKSGEETNFFIMPDVGAEISKLEEQDISEEEKLKKEDELLTDFSIKSERIHTINQLLKAYTMFEKENEYIIADSKIKIVDEQTGRVLDGRRYSEGLHQAIEAKENVKVEKSTQTYATITLQNYFRMYHKLSGMTGTAETEAGEFWQIYKLDVVVVPTNEPIIREDNQDMIFKTKREKFNSVADEIEKFIKNGNPILVGTTSIETSELVSRLLTRRKIKHNVLNAKQHQREAEIVKEAGLTSNVTIATNMAGRGTDIKLGEGVVDAGGLAIIGTERHESRRIDRQLRGRAGRQGDPGASQFYVCLEDDLMRLFGSERISKYMDRLGLEDGEVIQHSMITKSIERAQKKVEENNFGIRKRLLEYDDVMNSQREVIYKRRRNALYGDRLEVDINNMLVDLCEDLVEIHKADGDFDKFNLDVMRFFAMQSSIPEKDFFDLKINDLVDKLYDNLKEKYNRKVESIAEKAFPIIKHVFKDRGKTLKYIVVPFSDGNKNLEILVDLEKAYKTKGKEILRSFEKLTTLQMIDDAWKVHLRELDDLKQSVQNASYEQKDPILIYKLESFNLFEKMLGKISRDVLPLIFKGDIITQDPDAVEEGQATKKADLSNLKESRPGDFEGTQMPEGSNTQSQRKEPVRVENKVGRNDPCPCGSGKKYKHCHGKL